MVRNQNRENYTEWSSQFKEIVTGNFFWEKEVLIGPGDFRFGFSALWLNNFSKAEIPCYLMPFKYY